MTTTRRRRRWKSDEAPRRGGEQRGALRRPPAAGRRLQPLCSHCADEVQSNGAAQNARLLSMVDTWRTIGDKRGRTERKAQRSSAPLTQPAMQTAAS